VPGPLLAVPLLVRHGLIEAFLKVYGSLHPSSTVCGRSSVTLFWRPCCGSSGPSISKNTVLKDLGAILGLDRAPEVKTVRRKFTRLAACSAGSC